MSIIVAPQVDHADVIWNLPTDPGAMTSMETQGHVMWPTVVWFDLHYDLSCHITVMVMGLRPANERRRYFATTSLIGWVQA